MRNIGGDVEEYVVQLANFVNQFLNHDTFRPQGGNDLCRFGPGTRRRAEENSAIAAGDHFDCLDTVNRLHPVTRGLHPVRSHAQQQSVVVTSSRAHRIRCAIG